MKCYLNIGNATGKSETPVYKRIITIKLRMEIKNLKVFRLLLRTLDLRISHSWLYTLLRIQTKKMLDILLDIEDLYLKTMDNKDKDLSITVSMSYYLLQSLLQSLLQYLCHFIYYNTYVVLGYTRFNYSHRKKS